jgi:hypothetical protein
MPRTPWSVLVNTVVAEPRWERLRTAVSEVIRAHVRGDATPNQTPEFYPAIQAVIAANVGPWYGEAHRAGDEMVRGWCWCHAPWKGWGGQAVEASIEAATESVVGEVAACLAWYRAIVATITASDPPGDDPEALARIVVDLVDRVVSLGIHDDWYHVVAPAVGWALERHGLVVDDTVEDAVRHLLSRHFTSWVTPAAKDRQEFAEATALELLDRDLERRWPSA